MTVHHNLEAKVLRLLIDSKVVTLEIMIIQADTISRQESWNLIYKELHTDNLQINLLSS